MLPRLRRPPRLPPLAPTRASTTARGTAYELTTLRFLSSPPLSLSLLRVGGANDKGVDLRGWWDVPPRLPDQKEAKRWSVVVQCKAEKEKLGPSVIRDLEGAVAHGMDGVGGKGVEGRGGIAVLVALSGFSPASLILASSSSTPLLLLHLAEGIAGKGVDEGIGKGEKGGWMRVEKVVVNEALRGLVGLQVARVRRAQGGWGVRVGWEE